jgi:hypothetical protein
MEITGGVTTAQAGDEGNHFLEASALPFEVLRGDGNR